MSFSEIFRRELPSPPPASTKQRVSSPPGTAVAGEVLRGWGDTQGPAGSRCAPAGGAEPWVSI